MLSSTEHLGEEEREEKEERGEKEEREEKEKRRLVIIYVILYGKKISRPKNFANEQFSFFVNCHLFAKFVKVLGLKIFSLYGIT